VCILASTLASTLCHHIEVLHLFSVNFGLLSIINLLHFLIMLLLSSENEISCKYKILMGKLLVLLIMYHHRQ